MAREARFERTFKHRLVSCGLVCIVRIVHLCLTKGSTGDALANLLATRHTGPGLNPIARVRPHGLLA
jgi:hypothetical protein